MPLDECPQRRSACVEKIWPGDCLTYHVVHPFTQGMLATGENSLVLLRDGAAFVTGDHHRGFDSVLTSSIRE